MQIFTRYSWALFFLILAACHNERVRNIPVEDFFRDPQKTFFNISPDGKYISYLQPYHNRLNIFVQTIDGESATRLTSYEDRNISYYFWANNNELLYLQDRTSQKSGIICRT